MKKLIRTSTIALSLDLLLKGQLRFLNNYYDVVALSGEDICLRTVEEREGIRVVPIEMQRQIAPFKDLISLWKLYVFFKKEKPGIVHSITPKAGLLSMTAAWLAGVPVRMHTFTGLIFPSKTGIVRKVLIVMDKILCRLATNIYPEGEGVKNDLIRYKITNKPLKILANGNVNGIDVQYFSPDIFLAVEKAELRQSLQIAPDDFVFVFVGRLVRDKGINELAAAFTRLQKGKNNIKLLLVGPAEHDLDPLLPETIQLLENHKSIIRVGYQNDIRPYLAVSNALAFASYREGFPNVVMQAGAMGLPAIVTNINGCNEIIENGDNGMIVPPRDENALFFAMKEILENDTFRKQMAEQARPMIASRYEQKLVWEAILEEYRKFENQHASHV